MSAVETSASLPLRLELWGDWALTDPLFLLALPLVLVLVAWGRRPAGRPVLRAPLQMSEPIVSWRQRLLFVPLLLQVLGLSAVAVGLARPVQFDVLKTSQAEGVDIVLVVDRSSSMEFTDLERGRTRLDVVKDVVGEFAARRMTDSVGASDSVALMSFARFPELRCPFTLDVDALDEFLGRVEIVKHRGEDGTAIGAALAKAAALLDSSEAKSKVVVLLTDGENTVDDITPAAGTAMLKQAGVKVYTVLAARLAMGRDHLGRLVDTGRAIDSTGLETIAEETGGLFFRARDRESLTAIYAEIEALERTPREEQRRVETRDRYPAWLAAALGLFVLARLLGAIGLSRGL